MTQSEPSGFADAANADAAAWTAIENARNAHIHAAVNAAVADGLTRQDAITSVMRAEGMARGDIAACWWRHERRLG